MPETHHIIGGARGEPLAAGAVGARLRVPLSGTPGPHWSGAFTASLTQSLAGHRHVGHLRLDHVVQGGELVLDGVEDDEAAALGACLQRAVDAANEACANDAPPEPANMSPQDAATIAGKVQI